MRNDVHHLRYFSRKTRAATSQSSTSPRARCGCLRDAAPKRCYPATANSGLNAKPLLQRQKPLQVGIQLAVFFSAQPRPKTTHVTFEQVDNRRLLSSLTG